MTDFDPEFDKLPDQPVTIGGDKSAAAWHPGSASDAAEELSRQWKAQQDGWGHTDTSGRLLEARFSRFHGLMLSVTGDGNKMGSTVYVDEALPDLLEYIAKRAPEALALHDAEVKAQALNYAKQIVTTVCRDELSDYYGQVRVEVNAALARRAAEIREEGK